MTDKWEPPKDVKIHIVCAATQFDDNLVIAGARHFDDVMHGVIRRIFPTLERAAECSKSEQGFIDQFGRFYTREEAYDIVQSNGQAFNPERNRSTKALFSEGLY